MAGSPVAAPWDFAEGFAAKGFAAKGFAECFVECFAECLLGEKYSSLIYIYIYIYIYNSGFILEPKLQRGLKIP